jgi:hypothetical protein
VLDLVGMRLLSAQIGLAVVAIILAVPVGASAQVIVTNSMVTYGYQEAPANTFTPPSPLISESPYSELSFASTGLVANSSTAFPNPITGGQVSTLSGILTVDMTATPGMWFSGTNALALDVAGSYSMSAPFGSSEAFTSISASYTVYLQEVDGVAFSSSTTLNGQLSIMPTNVFTLSGPGTVASGLWNGSLSLDINAIKAHFGIASTNNVTGMRLQYSTVLTAAGRGDGTAYVDTLNFTVTNQVVPEPSTYALLLLAVAFLGIAARRRRVS